ncbi:AAA family ATPase [Aquibacillus koreensis]|uniref:AAA family ATPase n=1 Tax=Aquibacillus koreensis TaxID=279446 RepID=A0A9X4AIH4_9BACI|nr:MoxR family ATPase [Aquibacillus koreensis]MCT2534211.1 AAA family ATPase [Aquibacillus koreensis]MDC3420744.1 AAA family ATPase [Aquibacillus koreensis]
MTNIEEKSLLEVKEKIIAVKEEIGKFIVGQDEVVAHLLLGIFAQGHVLLEGLPGLGKTILVRKIAEVMDLRFSRVQFTPDLMPSDITGTNMIQPNEAGGQSFVFHEGPLFSNIVLADEINRATPKTQSALLEAMGERTVTVMGEMRHLPAPFFVLATQNPIELEGTYPLPEAQMDRFIMKIDVAYPTRDELKEIARRTTSPKLQGLEQLVDANFVVSVQELAKHILVADQVLDYAVNVIMASHPEEPNTSEQVKKYIRYGSGPRGLQSLIAIAKVQALFNGRFNVSIGDIKKVAFPVLRHRLFLNFEGEAAAIHTDDLIREILDSLEERV